MWWLELNRNGSNYLRMYSTIYKGCSGLRTFAAMTVKLSLHYLDWNFSSKEVET